MSRNNFLKNKYYNPITQKFDNKNFDNKNINFNFDGTTNHGTSRFKHQTTLS